MYDSTPAPIGDVTRRWTALTDHQRQAHAARLLGQDCGSGAPTHVDRPGLDDGACYHRLVPAAAAGDPIAGHGTREVTADSWRADRDRRTPSGHPRHRPRRRRTGAA